MEKGNYMQKKQAILVMFDSLNRRFLPPFGCDWVHAPNFERLAEKTVVFDNSFVGSVPCMPARRELHTGRYNFLHRSWGPIEPFDDSMPEILKNNGVYTHLTTDHCHYFKEGGSTYHTRYNSWEFNRGQEGDSWKADLSGPGMPEFSKNQLNRPGYSKTWHDWINRGYMKTPEDQPQRHTFAQGIDFMKKNNNCGDWFLQIETFDPHEPFFTHEKYKKLYKHDYKGKFYDWPQYKRADDSDEEIEHIKKEYAALVTMCDESLGRLLDTMDENNMWENTMLIVCADHGYSLSENGWWAKNSMPWYNTTSNTPLFIWDPRCGRKNERNDNLVQFIDFAPTLLEYFELDIPADMQGCSLGDTIAKGESVRQFALFGLFGAHVNITDGRYVYMRAPVTADNQPLFEYTLLPIHMHRTFSTEELQNMEITDPLKFTKDCKVLKVKGYVQQGAEKFRHEWKTEMYDIKSDYRQLCPIKNADIEKYLIENLIAEMKKSDAPDEQFVRLGLEV